MALTKKRFAGIKWRLKKGDPVQVISGKDKGKRGKILAVFPKEGKAIVEGVNIVKRHMRPTRDNPQGGIVDMPAPIWIWKLMYVCPKCNRPVRLGYKFLEDGKKVRYCKKCGEVVDKV